MALDEKQDRSMNIEHHSRAVSIVLNSIIEFRMKDIWRMRNPKAQDSTHSSTVHNSWARLDYWLLTEQPCTWTRNIQHLPKTLSDHKPVLLELQIPTYVPPPFVWRFNVSALLDPLYKDTIHTAIVDFFTFKQGIGK